MKTGKRILCLLMLLAVLASLFAVEASAEAEIPPREMWYTHYSPSMTNPKQYIEEMQKIFPNVKCGKVGMTAVLNFDED